MPPFPYRVRIWRPVDCLGGARACTPSGPQVAGRSHQPPSARRLPIAGGHCLAHHLSPGVPNTARGYSA